MLPSRTADLTVLHHASTNLRQYQRLRRLTRFQGPAHPCVYDSQYLRYSTGSSSWNLDQNASPHDDSVDASSSSNGAGKEPEETSASVPPRSTHQQDMYRRTSSLSVRTQGGLRSILDFFAVLREIERRYGTVDQFRVHRDKDVSESFQPNFYVSFKSPESLERVANGETFVIPKPVPSDKDLDISYEDLHKYLRPVPIEEHGSKRISFIRFTEDLAKEASSPLEPEKRAKQEPPGELLEVELQHMRTAWEPLTISTNYQPLSATRHRSLSRAYVRWGGFSRMNLNSENHQDQKEPPMEGHIDTHPQFYQYHFSKTMEQARQRLVDEQRERIAPDSSRRDSRQPSETEELPEDENSPSIPPRTRDPAGSWHESEEDILTHLESAALDSSRATANKVEPHLPKESVQMEEHHSPSEAELTSTPSTTPPSSSSWSEETLLSEPATPLDALPTEQTPPQTQPTEQSAHDTKPKPKPKPKPKKPETGLWIRVPSKTPDNASLSIQKTETKPKPGEAEAQTLGGILKNWLTKRW